MKKDMGNPSLFLLDLRPVSYPMCVVTNHEVAEQISRTSKLFPWSTPKSPTLGDLVHLVGPHSILTLQNEEWKQLRKRFNSGFAPSHLMTFLPTILDKTWVFLKHLDGYARTGEEFSLERLTVNLTFDIIGAVVMDTDFDAQHLERARQGQFIQLYGALISSFTNDDGRLPWWTKPHQEWRRYTLGKKIDSLLQAMVRARYAEMRQPGAKPSRSVLSLSLHGVTPLTDQILKDTCDQLKTFIFAGHDTTSILLAWAIYELSRTPHAQSALRAELDAIFGPDPDPASVRAKLLSAEGEDLVKQMAYTSAVIKETLRLHPPAGTARMAPPGSNFIVRTPEGAEVCLDGMVIYNAAYLIQRDPAVYGSSANDFSPERWLGDTDTSMEKEDEGNEKKTTDRTIPVSAWRPFERGPRNCIGQELANIEARVILAVVARRYDFTKVGVGEVALNEKGLPTLDEKGQYKVMSELFSVSVFIPLPYLTPMISYISLAERPCRTYGTFTNPSQTRQVTSKPVDGTRMRVQLTPNASLNLD